MTDADRRFMLRALALARLGLGMASPNPSVGCVVVKGGEVVGEAFHVYSELDHAEVRAIRQAGRLARGATVYVSLEPCSHHGRTPPCADMLIESGVRRVVVSAIDPNPRVCGRGIEKLRGRGIPVEIGLMRRVAERIIEPFACHARTGRPLVVSKVGMSLDGRIAVSGGRKQWISSEAARAFGQTLRHELDAILVGIGTILKDDPQLTYRGRESKARPLVRVVLDSILRTPPAARIFSAGSPSTVTIFCSPDAPKARRERLEENGVEVHPIPCVNGRLDLKSVLKELSRRGILGLLVEGGSTVHWSFVQARMVDKFYFNIAPMVLGGRNSVPAVGGQGYATVAAAPRFLVERHFQAGPDVILETYPSYSRSFLSPWKSGEAAPSSSRYCRRTSQRK